MTAIYRGELVRIVGKKPGKVQIATRRGLRWVRTSELEVI